MFQAHIRVSAATFDAGTSFAQMAKRVTADKAVGPDDFQLPLLPVERDAFRPYVHSRFCNFSSGAIVYELMLYEQRKAKCQDVFNQRKLTLCHRSRPPNLQFTFALIQ